MMEVATRPAASEAEALFKEARRRERRRRVFVVVAVLAVLAAVAGTLDVVFGGGPSRSSAEPSATTRGLPTARTTKSCTSQIVTLPGAPARLGLDAHGVPAPVWSGVVGTVQGIAGDDVITTIGSDCVAAVDASAGHTLWVKALDVAGSGGIEGLTAGSRVVVAGVARVIGRSPDMVYAVIDGLVGLDPVSGRPMWKLSLGPDGQELPAVVEGSTVVVSKPNGVVQGVSASSGALEWTDPAPKRCGTFSGQPPGLDPKASIVSGGSLVVVDYHCRTGRVSAIDPTSGRKEWTWRTSRRTSVLWQAREVIAPTTPPDVGAGIVAVGEASVGSLGVPSESWDPGANTAETYDVVILDEQTGHPLWVLRGVPTPSTSAEPDVAIGGGNLCVGHAADVECWTARTGAPAWHWSAPERSSPQGVVRMPGLAIDSGQLFMAVPTAAAAKIDPSSTTERSAPGTFMLMAFDLTDGTVLTSEGLPAYYRGRHRSVVVSDTNPPDVRVAVDGVVLLTPSAGTGVIEALRPW